MAASVSSTGSLLPWLLAGALVLSVGVNLYCLTPDYQSVRQGRVETAKSVGFFDSADDDEEQDSAWTALHEELRQTRQRLSACQGQAAAARTAALGADTLARR